MSDFLRPHGLEPTRFLHPWNFPGKSTGVGCHFKSKLYLSLAFAYIFAFFLLLDNWYFPKALTLPQLSIIYCIQISDILRLNSWSRNGSQRTASHPINFKLNSYFNSHSRHRVKVAQLCPTLCEPMNCTVHGILQARILEWVAVSFSWGSSQPRGQTQVSHILGEFFTIWATRHKRGGQNGNSKQLSIYLMTLYLIHCDKKHFSRAFSFLNDQITLLTVHIIRLLALVLFLKFLSIPY